MSKNIKTSNQLRAKRMETLWNDSLFSNRKPWRQNFFNFKFWCYLKPLYPLGKKQVKSVKTSKIAEKRAQNWKVNMSEDTDDSGFADFEKLI